MRDFTASISRLNGFISLKSYGLALLLVVVSSYSKAETYELRYDKPAEKWTEALPVGNGRLGAMIYGGTAHEIIQFNEETLWTGQPHDYAHVGAWQFLSEIRNLLWSGQQKEAHSLANQEFMSKPLGQQAYQPFGTIRLDFPNHQNFSNYQRNLTLDNALSTVTYEIDGTQFKREVFASFPDQAILIKITANKPNALNFSVSLGCPHQTHNITTSSKSITLTGKANNYPNNNYEKKGNFKYPLSKVTFEGRLIVENTGGKTLLQGDSIRILQANTVVLKLVAATNFVNYNDLSGNPTARCATYLKKLKGKKYETLQARHIADYQSLYKRLTIDLGRSELSNRCTNERLNTYSQDLDPNLVALLYQYGRYLMISSSRPGTQPANLQGIWNDQLAPPWDSKYTTNINAEMNYWIAETTNLSECAQPLFGMIKDLSITGRKVAKEHYNLPGWAFHHNTDIWRGAAPINGSDHGIWMGGSGWICEHLWWHYEFTGDKKFLLKKAYPIMKGAAEFYAAYLVPDPKHPEWLISGPSNSPENGGLVMGPTMDHQIIRNLFTNTIEAGKILGIDSDFCTMLKEKKSKIAPNQIGKYGQLQEWMEDKDNPKSDHRHVSHLWGLHPGSEISPLTTPELAQACKVTLQQRGDEGTGWSRAWKINFWARLLDGNHAYLLLNKLMIPSTESDKVNMSQGGGLYPNLFDAHPPFQIDGNFGATSGITEMILQSQLRDANGTYFLDLLPALPSGLPNGKITGLVARGGFEVDIAWQAGNLTSVLVRSRIGSSLNLRYQGKITSIPTKKGKTYLFSSSNGILKAIE